MEKCIKCGFESEKNSQKFGVFLCTLCKTISPNNQEEFKEYIHEIVPSENQEILAIYRKYTDKEKSLKKSMSEKASKGNPMSRPAFGYFLQEGKLIPAENFREVQDIFEEFVNEKVSLNQLAKKHHFSVNGIKKILKNFTYVGKIKFNGEIHQGSHQPLISNTLFNHAQNKLSKISKNNYL